MITSGERLFANYTWCVTGCFWEARAYVHSIYCSKEGELPIGSIILGRRIL